MKIELMINSSEVQIIIQSALPSVKYLRQQNKKKNLSRSLYYLYFVVFLGIQRVFFGIVVVFWGILG